jgi:hypothetical protein
MANLNPKYTKPVARLVDLPAGRFVVTITDSGVDIRAALCRRGVHVSYEQLAALGLAANAPEQPLERLKRGIRQSTPDISLTKRQERTAP